LFILILSRKFENSGEQPDFTAAVDDYCSDYRHAYLPSACDHNSLILSRQREVHTDTRALPGSKSQPTQQRFFALSARCLIASVQLLTATAAR
jgi:hypothetical protein